MKNVKITDYFKEGKLLGRIIARVQQLTQWNDCLQSCLAHEPQLRKHCKIVNFQDHSLIIVADSAAWLLKLRFQTPLLLEKMRQQPGLESTRHITCKVLPQYQKVSYPITPSRLHLNPQTAQTIKDIASQVADEHIRQLLEKIANYTKN